ncbi:hypothetical protein L1887_14972 [Cichorium endivia]|nr:hypothetical protein L1887_14972 [Cichorium endivia]
MVKGAMVVTYTLVRVSVDDGDVVSGRTVVSGMKRDVKVVAPVCGALYLVFRFARKHDSFLDARCGEDRGKGIPLCFYNLEIDKQTSKHISGDSGVIEGR